MIEAVRTGQKNIILILFLFWLAMGSFFRVYGLGERNLWTDEAWVALAATQATPAEVLQEGKSTPPLYLLTVWGMVQVLGKSEAVLRLTSCLLGLGALLLFWPLAQALLPPWRALTVFALASVSPRLVYFSKELKQYSADIFFAVLVFWLVERQLHRQGRGGWLLLTVLLAIGLGYSHPLVFILPVAGLVLWWELPKARREVFFSFGSIGLIFLGYYSFFFRGQVDPELLIYWQADFPDLTCGTDFLCWLGGAWSRFGRYFFNDWGAPLGSIFLVAGLGYFYRSPTPRVIWYFFGPLLAALAAALAQRYPFMGHAGGVRLMMFSAPMLYLVIGAGIGAIFHWLWGRQSWAFAQKIGFFTPHPDPLPSRGEGMIKEGPLSKDKPLSKDQTLSNDALLSNVEPLSKDQALSKDELFSEDEPPASEGNKTMRLIILSHWFRLAGIVFVAVVVIWLEPVKLWQENTHPQANREEIEPLVHYVQMHRRPGDLIYVYYFAIDPFKFYYQGPRDNIIWGQSCHDGCLPLPPERLQQMERLWLIFSHFETAADVDRFIKNLLGEGWTRELELSQPGAVLFYYLPPWAKIAPTGR